MRAIVTGSNGFIGYNVCKELKKLDWKVCGVDDLSSGLPENIVDGFFYCHEKVQNRDEMSKLFSDFRPNVVFHFAAIPRVAYSIQEPSLTTETNVFGTISLLETIVKEDLVGKTRFILSSSSSVYGGADLRPTREDYPYNARSPYALQKQQSELWVRMFSELYDVDGVNLRYFNVFGPHALFGGAYTTVLTAWLYHLYVQNDYQPYLEGDGTQSRDFCFVENVVQANILAATREVPFAGQSINIAQGNSHTLLQVRDLLEEISGQELILERRPPRIGDVKHSLADISLAEDLLDYKPSTDFFAQLTVMAKWYQNSYPQAAKKLHAP